MLNPADFGLKRNPFSIVPNEEGERHWAGLPETKRALADVVNSVRPDDVGASEFVVLHGEYGAGKSHALRHFRYLINKSEEGYAVCMNEVMVGSSLSFHALCKNIFEGLSDSVAMKLSRVIRESVDGEVEKIRLSKDVEVAPDTVIENQVESRDHAMVKSLYHGDKFALPSAWNDYAAVKVIASASRVMTTGIGESRPLYGAVYLFLDEVESTLEQRAANQVAFFGALRSLINEVAEHFALVLSFTAPTAVLEAAVPAGLKERMTRPYIQCHQLTAEGGKDFVREYLEYVRPVEGVAPKHPFYPFSEDAIDSIFDREAILVPRRILMRLRRVWERAARGGGLEPGGEIDREMADEILAAVV